MNLNNDVSKLLCDVLGSDNAVPTALFGDCDPFYNNVTPVVAGVLRDGLLEELWPLLRATMIHGCIAEGRIAAIQSKYIRGEHEFIQ